MSYSIDPDGGGFPPVEFLDIPPMDETLERPPAAPPHVTTVELIDLRVLVRELDIEEC